MPEKFHHPHVDQLRDAAKDGPPLSPARLGPTFQRRLHARVVKAMHDERESPRRWGPGASPEDDQDRYE